MLSPSPFRVLKDNINNRDVMMFITIKAASLLAQISDLFSDNTTYIYKRALLYIKALGMANIDL